MDGTLACWGDPATGINAAPAGTFDRISVGGDAACATKTADGALVCWGGANAPAPDIKLDEVDVDTAGSICGVITGTHKVWCLDPADNPSADPGEVTEVSVLPGFGVGGCAVKKADQALVCWGSDTEAALKPPAGIGKVTDVELGFEFGCAIKVNGYVACWGTPQGGGPKGASPATPAPAPAASGKVGSSYDESTFTSDIGTPGGEFKVVAGTLPPGLELARGNTIEGVPTKAGTYTFTIAADNDVFEPGVKEFTITITGGAGQDTEKPELTEFLFSSTKPKKGKKVTVQFVASEAGTFVATYARCTGRGTTNAKRCKKTTKAVKLAGSLTAVAPGANSFTFSTGKLPVGVLKLSFAMVDTAGNASAVSNFALTVRKKR